MISAGFLLADATATMAKKFPDTHFAITDYPVEAAPFADKKGKPLYDERRGPDLRGERGRLPRRRARREDGRSGWARRSIGAVGGLKIPPVDIWIAGYQLLRAEGRSRHEGAHRLLAGLRRARTSARPSPRTRSRQGAQVLFQVAGGCGLGTLKAADEAGKWGIGVDVDQYKLAQARAHERRQAGRQRRLRRRSSRCRPASSPGGTDLVFNLKNDGVGVGKINPAVPEGRTSTLMNSYKAKIIAGKLKLPSSL